MDSPTDPTRSDHPSDELGADRTDDEIRHIKSLGDHAFAKLARRLFSPEAPPGRWVAVIPRRPQPPIDEG